MKDFRNYSISTLIILVLITIAFVGVHYLEYKRMERIAGELNQLIVGD